MEPIYTNRSRAEQLKRDDCVKENGKYYYKICKCGDTKENYKNSYCNFCSLERFNKYKEGKTFSYIGDQTMFPGKAAKKGLYEKFLNEFITRIKNNDGMCSLEDIMVHLITLHNYFFSGQHLDKLSMGKQVTKMWEELQEENMKINSRVIIRSNKGFRTCRYCKKRFPSSEMVGTNSKCKECAKK